MFNMEKIGAFIASKRKNSGLTQGQFAEKVGVTHQAVSKWERGEAMPEISKIGDIAALLETTPDEILMQAEPETDPDGKTARADKAYMLLGDKASVAEVYALAPDMSPELLSEAVSLLYGTGGSNALTFFIPFLTEGVSEKLIEKIYEKQGVPGVLPFGDAIPPKTAEKIILTEYSRGNSEDAKRLLPYCKNDRIVNAVFDSEVAKDNTWNSLQSVITRLPSSVIVPQAVKYALNHDLSSFNWWWGRLGRENTGKILAEYVRARGYSRDAWRHAAAYLGNGSSEPFREAIRECEEALGADSVAEVKEMLDNSRIPGEGAAQHYKRTNRRNSTDDWENMIDELENKIDDLENRIDELESRINDLE